MSEEVWEQLGLTSAVKFGDIYEAETPWNLTHTQVVNKTIVVIAFEPITTGYGDALLADCVVDGDRTKVLIGGKVLIEQLTRVQEHLPIETTIRKKARYYEFT